MMKNLSVVFLAFIITQGTLSQITLNPSTNANALAQSLAGQGVTISNASLSAAANAVGFFNANPNTNLGISSGIVLTTGQLSDITQSANAGSGGIGASYDNFAGGDVQLEALSGNLIFNASALTFDVTPLGNTLTFRYVFMSEEYPDYVCSEYNDVFGFFVSGPRPLNLGGGNYSNVNIALVPNTNLPVGINTVNSGVPGSGYSISGCQGSNTIYFRNNFGNPYIVYNAGTVVLTATIQVIPCSTYTFKLAVGDGSDAFFDSGVFLEEGSFTSNTATINTVFSHTGYTTTYEGCSSASVIFNFTAPFAGSAVFDYVISGTATNGVDYQFLPGSILVPQGATTASIDIIPIADNLPEGVETVIISLFQPCSNQPYAQATVTITDTQNVSATASKTQLCPNETSVLTATGSVSYVWSPPVGLSNPNSPQTTANPPSDQLYTVTGTTGNCTSTASILIERSNITASGVVTQPQCNNPNGSIDLTVQNGKPGYVYSWNDGATSEDRLGVPPGTYTVTVRDAFNCSVVVSFTITPVPASVQVSGTKTDVSCNGSNDGSITLTVSGGSPGYSFLWNDGVTTQNRSGLSAGTYTVLVTDNNGCTGTASFNIAPGSNITLNTQVTNTTCGQNNGSISVTATGGSGNYTYAWNTGAQGQILSNLAAATYTVIVTDGNGCTQTASATVAPSNPINVVPTVTNVTCNGGNNGSITLNVSGGSGNYTYLWNDNATSRDRINIQAGPYTVTVTDAQNSNCTSVVSVQVSQPTAIQISGQVSSIACNGNNNGSITLTVSGGSPGYSFLWNDGVTTQNRNGLGAGTYSVIVTDNSGCTASFSAQISSPAPIQVSITKTDVLCHGQNTGSATATAQPPGNYTYSWSIPATGPIQNNLAAGSYSLTVTDANQCSAIATVTINQPAAPLSVTYTKNDISCGNPAGGSAVINATGGTSGYSYTWNVQGITGSSPTGLAAGNYIVTVRDVNNCSASVSFDIFESPSVTLTSTSTSVSCNGGSDGSASVTASGGDGNYTYLWNNGGQTSVIQNIPAGTYTVIVTDGAGCTGTAQVTVNQPQPIVINETYSDVVCNTLGSIDITVTGGNGNYQYVWSDNVTSEDRNNLTAGTYIVLIRDAKSCTATKTIVISNNSYQLNISGNVSQPLCNGQKGSIQLTVSGANPPLNFTWSDGITLKDRTNLNPGSYWVTVTDANGCSNSQNYTIVEPASINITANITGAGCSANANDGSIVLTVSGGTPNYTYLWNDNATTKDRNNLSAGTYFVTVRDANGCTSSYTAVVPSSTPLQASKQSTNTKCNGGKDGTASVSVSGGDGNYTFVWSNNVSSTSTATNLPAGTYIVTITDGKGCTLVENFVIGEPAPIIVSANPTPNICFGVADGTVLVSVSGGQAPYNYAVKLDNSPNPINRNSGDFTELAAGNYTATVTDNLGCSASAPFEIAAALEDKFIFEATPTSCYETQSKDGSIKIVILSSLNGPYQFSFNGGNYDSISQFFNLYPGDYFITSKNKNGCVVNNKVTVNAALPIIAEFPRDTFYVDLGHQTQLTLNIGNLDSAVIEWSSEKKPDYLNFTCSNCSELSPISSTPFTNNYSVKVYDKENPSCYKTTSVSVIVSNEVAIPNVFTPNGDNVNDKFYPVFNNKEVKLREFKIYNRWGQIVHQEATMGWDGTFESIQQPVGSYKYFIVYEKLNTSTGKTELKNKSGTFTLLR